MRIHCRKGASVEERLRLHMVEAPSGCWVWTGARHEAGYGRFQVDGKTRYAHRISYELFVGPIPDGFQIDHLCRRPPCINPRHLQAVTPQVNVRRGTSPGARAQRRERCLRGHAYAEFGVTYSGRRVCRMCQKDALRGYFAKSRDMALARELRDARRGCGISQATVAGLLGISQSQVSQMETGRADITGEAERRLRDLYTEDAA